jgi:hypothetical protein
MGGGMRSVPATDLPSALLNPGQTRALPTRLISLSRPDADEGLRLPAEGEALQIVGDVAEVNSDARVEKALKRLASETVASSVSQLVMWNVAAGLDWETIKRLSNAWANDYELTLAKDFVARLDTLPEGESGRIYFQVEARDSTANAAAEGLCKFLDGKTILGLVAHSDRPAQPDGPAVACSVKVGDKEAQVQVFSTDARATAWIPFGKFTVPVPAAGEKPDHAKFVDSLAEGLVNRLARAQVSKPYKENGKLVYPLRIDNASPLLLNGIAAVGTNSKPDDTPRVLAGLSLLPHKSFTITASAQVVQSLNLKQGVKLTALNLSGL